MAGNYGGPQPWWQEPGGAQHRTNLEQQAPGGYYYDPVKMSYLRKPSQVGSDQADVMKGYYGSLQNSPAMQGLSGLGGFGGGSGGSGLGEVSYGGGGGGGSTSFPSATTPYAPAPQVAQVAPIDDSAAHAAAFGRAKEEAGNTASAAMTGLQGELARRGMGGAGYEGGQIGNTLARAANTTGEASRAEAESSFQSKQREAEMNYQGALTQRGQDVNAGLTARGQDFSREQALNSLAAQERESKFSGGITQRGQNLQLLLEQLRHLYGSGPQMPSTLY